MTVGGTTLAIAKLKDTGYLKSTSEMAQNMKDTKEKIDNFKENRRKKREDE